MPFIPYQDHSDLLHRAVMFHSTDYKNPEQHSRKMEKRFGAVYWQAFSSAAAQSRGLNLCRAAWESAADEIACRDLNIMTLNDQRMASLAKLQQALRV